MRKFIIGRMRVKPGTRDELLAAAKPFIQQTRAEPGCVFFEMAVSASDPDGVLVAEEFKDAAAHDFHDKSAHMDVFRAVLGRLLVETQFEFIYSDKVDTNGGTISRPIT
jgi:quinol monooxygenase YgiN